MKLKLTYLPVIGCIAFAACESHEYSEEAVDSTTMIVPDNTRSETPANTSPNIDTASRTDSIPFDTGNINTGKQ